MVSLQKLLFGLLFIIIIINSAKEPLNDASPYISTLTGSDDDDLSFFNIGSNFENYRGGVCRWMPDGDDFCEGGQDNEHYFEGILDLSIYNNPVLTLDYTYTNGGNATSIFYINCNDEYEILLDINLVKPFRCNAYDHSIDQSYDYATVSLPDICKNNNNVRIKWDYQCNGNQCLWFAFRNILIVDTTDLDGVNACIDTTLSPTKTTFIPSITPTNVPTTLIPTISPTIKPTLSPSLTPTLIPTNYPTNIPMANPTTNPTATPTTFPTNLPTKFPTNIPTIIPSLTPTILTNMPSQPTIKPTNAPTSTPTNKITMTTTTLISMSPTTSELSIIKEQNISIPKVFKIRMVNVYTFFLLYIMIIIFIFFRIFYYLCSNKRLRKNKRERHLQIMHQNALTIDRSHINVVSQQHCIQTSTQMNMV